MTRNHGHLVCVAGINQNNEFRRLYPFEFEYGVKSINFSKKNVIKVNVASPDHDKRKESRKVTYCKPLYQKLEDNELRDRILPLVSSIEKMKNDGASLGILRPLIEDVDIQVNSTDIIDRQVYFNATGDYLEQREKVKMPVKLRYSFKCRDEPDCKGHKIVLIDWELNELARNIMKTDNDRASIEEKIRKKFYDYMLERDLYFFMGTHFRFGTWLIIGIFYPQKKFKTLFDYGN